MPEIGESHLKKLNHVNFATLAVTEIPKFRGFVKYSIRRKTEQFNFCCPFLFANWPEKQNYVPQN